MEQEIKVGPTFGYRESDGQGLLRAEQRVCLGLGGEPDLEGSPESSIRGLSDSSHLSLSLRNPESLGQGWCWVSVSHHVFWALGLFFGSLGPHQGHPHLRKRNHSVWPAGSLRLREGRAASQVLKNLFLLGSARQCPKRGSDLWADLLMIYPRVFRPGTCGTSCSRTVWKIFPAGIREHEVENQAPRASCQPLPHQPLPSLPRKGSFCFFFQGKHRLWSCGLVEALGMDQPWTRWSDVLALDSACV